MILVPSKACSQCKIEYAITLENFGREPRAKDGLRSECRECKRVHDKEYQAGYKLTEKGKAVNKRKGEKYRNSVRGKKKREQYAEEYRATVNGHLRNIFSSMLQRCNNPDQKAYKNYGGRGIKVCFESADEFVDYVINGLQIDPRKLQIDRIDNDGNYEKGNIRFVTRRENNENKRPYKKAENGA